MNSFERLEAIKRWDEFQLKFKKRLLEVLNSVPDQPDRPVKTEVNISELPEVKEMEKSIKYLGIIKKELARLEYHESTTVGLWAIDRDPREVSYEWIVENAFRITSPDSAPERVY